MVRVAFVASLVLVLSLGAFAYGSTFESHHAMGNGAIHHVCPLFGGASPCVPLIEHLAHFQLSFAAVIGEFFSFVVLLISGAIFFSWLQVERLRYLRYCLYVPPTPLENSLLPRHTLSAAFSRGIIHPKLF